MRLVSVDCCRICWHFAQSAKGSKSFSQAHNCLPVRLQGLSCRLLDLPAEKSVALFVKVCQINCQLSSLPRQTENARSRKKLFKLHLLSETHGTAAHQPQTLFKHIRNYSSNSFLSAEHNQIIKYLSSCFFRVRLTFFSLPRNSFACGDRPTCKSTTKSEFCKQLKVLLHLSTLHDDQNLIVAT